LYVGNLPWSATEQDVLNLFAQYGEVYDVSLIQDRETGRFRGFGFVEISRADAARAARAMDGYMFQGRTLRVREAAPKAPPAPSSRRELSY
jgi:RNA recognition motif-containing protein